MATILEVLNDIPLASLMLVVALGFAFGRASWRGVALGPAGATILLALVAGAAGLRVGPSTLAGDASLSLGAFGFALFIYSVGFEAGPRFFSAFRRGPGWRYVTVGVAVNVLAVLCVLAAASVLALSPASGAGALAGGLTSAPTYAAALEGLLHRGADIAPVTLYFVVTYPMGLVLLVLLVQFLPRLRGIDLATEAERASDETRRAPHTELSRVFEVDREAVVGLPLEALALPERTGAWLLRIHRGDAFLDPTADRELQIGDHVLARGTIPALRAFGRTIGDEVEDAALHDRLPAPRRAVVLARPAIGRTLRELALPDRDHVLVANVDRGGVPVDPVADLVLERGDVLELLGRRSDTRRVAERLGRLEQASHETDIAVYAGGILLGLLVGNLHLRPFGLDLTLGAAGGLLLAGILLGRLRRIGRFRTRVPRSARQLVRDLGILLFVGEAGLVAGASLGTVPEGRLLDVVVTAVAVTVIPVLLTLLMACRFLRLSPLEAWGSVSGGMTSSAALTTLQRLADGNEPALAYAAAYAPASVVATVAGQVVVQLLA